jgi:two-component system, NtrC family, response regulator GlrR
MATDSEGICMAAISEFKAVVIGADSTGQLYELKTCLAPRFRVNQISAAGSDVLEARPDLAFVSQSRATLELPASWKGLSIPIIALVNSIEAESILRLLDQGFSDFVVCPLKREDILPRAVRLVERNRAMDAARRFTEKFGVKRIVGNSASLNALLSKIPAVARCDATVLISGETGTGKELCARSIHYLSPRANNPFVPVNCGAIPTDLVENEFFGHERGAYTHATTSECGLIHEAEGGTLFLDEVDSLPPQAQVKLLRFLQEKEYRPVGSRKIRSANVRVIAALNVDLDQAIESGRLRRDLYYRLNVISFKLPPLRERRDDIPSLAIHFIQKYATEFHKECTGLSSDAVTSLMLYDWPGNIRELEHVIQRAVALSEGRLIGRADVALSRSETLADDSFSATKAAVIANFERTYILRLLHVHHGNITKAAQAAQKHRRAFWQLIRKHRIDVSQFKAGSRS